MKWPIEKKIATGFGLSLTILIIIGLVSYRNSLNFIETSRLETRARMILKKFEIVLTEIIDAETGQRGYIITGDKRYLEPYHAAIANIDQEVKELREMTRDNPDHQRRLDALKPLLAEKLDGLKNRIELRKTRGFEASAQEVRSGKGRLAMDNIRKIITEMEDNERELLKWEVAEAEASAKLTIFIIIFGSSLAFVIVGLASFITRKELIARKQAEEALQNSYTELEQKVDERTTELRRLNESLQREITERKQVEEQIKISLKEKEVLLKEVHHRVKNNLQVVYSLLNLQSKYIKDKQTLEMFEESQNRVKAMSLIHEKLYQSGDLAMINLADYARTLATDLARSYGASSKAFIKINANDVLMDINMAIPCGLIINELISNSLKHAFPESEPGNEETESKCEINVDIRLCDKVYTLKVSDNGVSLPKDFDLQNTTSLGLRLVNVLANQLGGTVEIDRSNGTMFKITFEGKKY